MDDTNNYIMKTLGEYKEIFRKKGIDISEEEISQIIENIDNIGNLLFNKYLQEIKDYEK